MNIPSPETFTDSFTQGNGVELPLDPDTTAAMHAELATVGDRLIQFPAENSFSWTDNPPSRHSGWLARQGTGYFATDRSKLIKFDANYAGGLVGLKMLGDAALEESIISLTSRADIALRAAALAIGVPEDFLEICSTRYRFIHYSGPGEGIGMHYDGNAISAVQTNAPGLFEARYDGTIHDVDPDTVSVMTGSSVYQGTSLSNHPLLPAFHGVRLESQGVKTSVAAFWNLPNGVTIPEDILGQTFHHDIGDMKELDGPNGPRGHLWEQVSLAHGISVAELVEGEFKQVS